MNAVVRIEAIRWDPELAAEDRMISGVSPLGREQ